MSSTNDGDEVLVARVRAGDKDAFEALFQRHHSMALYIASKQADNVADVEDIVSDAFAAVLQYLTAGKGPDTFFRAYLLTTVRRIAYKANQAGSRTRPTESYHLDSVEHHHDSILAEFESTAIAQAFTSLPERWQAVLWYIDIEEMKPKAASPLLGLSPNAVSSLVLRAREGLRQAYLQHHISTSVGKGCEEYSSRLGAYARKGLSARSEQKVRAHLDGCPKCTAVLLDLDDVQSAMRAALFPLMTGIGFTTAVQAVAAQPLAVPSLAAQSLAAPPAGAGDLSVSRGEPSTSTATPLRWKIRAGSLTIRENQWDIHMAMTATAVADRR
ncbi:sigma-70 family RNA polymerase sigma factor [Paenarthrobacter sp. NPDC091711]|uniref:sigma-70 family RNA polymerase sigma factor n=1 Tax=Paenarthrobacter sp. NPDC091711 TaxID=3364385 RepID=UPI0038148497